MKRHIYLNPFEKEKIVNKSLFKIQILLFILTFSCIYSCLSPLAGCLLQSNRKSFWSADQTILHLCLEPFLGILLRLRWNQDPRRGPEAPSDLPPTCSQGGSHTILSLSPQTTGSCPFTSQNLYQLSQHWSLPILFLLLKSPLSSPVCLDCLISSCRSRRKPHSHQPKVGPFQSFPRPCKPSEHPMCREDLLCLPDTLEGPEKASCVCLLHSKVLRRPPVSAWYTGTSCEDLLCLPVTLEGPYKRKRNAGLSKSDMMALKVEEGWRWRSDLNPKRLGGREEDSPLEPQEETQPNPHLDPLWTFDLQNCKITHFVVF